MAARHSIQDDIQRCLYRRMADACYNLVEHKDGLRYTIDRTEKPVSLTIHPVQSSFETQPGGCGRGFQKRVGLSYDAIMAFNCAVSMEAFEESYMKSPVRVTTHDGDTVIMILDQVTYQEPPEQQPSSGTRVTYRFVSLDVD